jgi:hypothetical protein
MYVHVRLRLKVHLHEIFWFKVVWPDVPIWASGKHPNIFSILISKIFDFLYICRVLSNRHKRASMLKQQSSITVYRLLTKENKLLFSVFVFRLQQTNGSCCFPCIHIYVKRNCIYICLYNVYIYVYVYVYV